MTTIHDYFKERMKLPSLPAIALKILAAVRQDESSFEELAQIIVADPALAARVLRIANSSLYGFSNTVSSISQATALIGTDALKNIALSFVIVQDFQDAPQGSFNMNLFWRRAITAAVAVETLAKYVGMQNRDLFVAALLQDIGVLILFLSDPLGYASLQDEKRVNGKTTCEVEQPYFGFDHTEVSSHLLTIWNLPETICRPIRLHHSEEKDEMYGEAALLLELSDKISAMYHGRNSNSKSLHVHRVLAEMYELSEKEIDQLIDAVGTKAQELLELFEIDPGDIKPFSIIMLEANEELGRLNFSYAQMVLELKQAKQSTEQLAIELKMANDNLRELAFRDGLTGLYNHRYFQEVMEVEVERAERFGHQVTFMLIDLDYFKKVNDTFGHPAGDHVLQEVANMLIKLVRGCDIVARYGGEEFAIILPETGVSGAKVLAQRVRRGIEQMKIKYGKQFIPVTISCGLATSDFAVRGTTRATLIKDSDEALYKAKKNGRNRVEMSVA